jgi:hypothetical protein
MKPFFIVTLSDVAKMALLGAIVLGAIIVGCGMALQRLIRHIRRRKP